MPEIFHTILNKLSGKVLIIVAIVMVVIAIGCVIAMCLTM